MNALTACSHLSRRRVSVSRYKLSSSSLTSLGGRSCSSSSVPPKSEAEADDASLSAPCRALREAFQAQATGHYAQAFLAYRRAQKARSPVLQALASNAEGLLLLRSSPGLFTLLKAPAFAGSAEDTTIPIEKLSPGDAILAPWLGDGEEYAASVKSIDQGQCVVDWDDGGQTHLTVPLAAVTSLRGGISQSALSHQTFALRLWMARRASRKALHAWDKLAENGTNHDAYLDLAGLLSDLALAEVRPAVLSSGQHLLVDCLEHARRHLQRARFSAERAWRPDARALALLGLHRAELARLTAASQGPSRALSIRSTDATRDGLTDSIQLHRRCAEHFTAAKWNHQRADAWSSFGSLNQSIIQDLLCAKALASKAVATRLVLTSRRGEKGSRVRPRYQPRQRHALPDSCPAQAAAFKAWRVLCAAASEPLSPEQDDRSLWTLSGAETRRLAEAVDPSAMTSRLLLEVAILLFSMGSKLGRVGWARAVAVPLAEIASARMSELSTVDDADLAAHYTALVMMGSISATESSTRFSRDALLGKVQNDEVTGAQRWARWRLFAYDPFEEIWVFKVGTRRSICLAAPPALTWCIEGLALSETACDLTGREP